MTTSRIGRGALVTLGAAASMAWAAGAANACDNTPHQPSNPKPPAPTNHNPDHLCKVSDDDVQYAVSDQSGGAVGAWHSTHGFYRTQDEPTYGYVVRLNPGRVAEGCTGTVPISLASYDADAAKWEDQTTPQTFVDFATTTLSTASKTSTTAHLTVKLPGGTAPSCFGQIDLYPGSVKYDGTHGNGVPDYKGGVHTPIGVWTAWNGSDAAGDCAAPSTGGSTTPPPSTGTTTTPPTTPPTTHPSTPVSSAPPAPPKPSSSTGTSTPSTPATTTSPGTPTLAHTGANVGEVSLVALAFFGAGGTAMFASRKAKLAGARKH